LFRGVGGKCMMRLVYDLNLHVVLIANENTLQKYGFPCT
jgi:hypothetical protein